MLDHHELPSDLRLGDLETFFAVQRYGAVTSAAHSLGVTPSQVSKAIARLETQFRVALLHRGTQGVTLSDEALRILPDLDQAMIHLRRAFSGRGDNVRALHFAGPSFLVSHYLPVVARALPDVSFCALELPPALLRMLAPENRFELGLIAGRASLPDTWHTRSVGEVRRGLFARPEVAAQLGPFPVDAEQLQAFPFITPVYTLNGQFVQSDDGCPLSFADRKAGHKTQTLRVALDLAAEVDQLLFAPWMAARAHVDEGRLVEVPVRGWQVADPLILACHPERLLALEFNTVAEAVERAAAAG
jgi:DNA-binding transcriptional LysR family regulator